MYKIEKLFEGKVDKKYYYESWDDFLRGWDRHANRSSRRDRQIALYTGSVFGFVGYRIDQEMPIDDRARANWEELGERFNRKATA